MVQDARTVSRRPESDRLEESMHKRTRRPQSPATALAVLALIVAVGGGSYAAASSHHTLSPKAIRRLATKIANGQITKRAVRLSVAHAGSADTATTAAGLTPPEPVHLVGAPGEPPFVGSAHNASPEYTPLGFWKDRECVVHLQGTILAESQQGVFRLPEADRPAQRVLAAIANTAPEAASVEVKPSGAVTPQTEELKPYDFGFDGVTFRAATC
jgi:hypothetical protein